MTSAANAFKGGDGLLRLLESLKDGEQAPRELSAETGLSISEALRRLELLKRNGFLSLPSDAGEHPEHI